MLSALLRCLDILWKSKSDVPLLLEASKGVFLLLTQAVISSNACSGKQEVYGMLDHIYICLCVWISHCDILSLITNTRILCVCLCVGERRKESVHVHDISPEPFAMQGSFFIHPALTVQRHPWGGGPLPHASV